MPNFALFDDTYITLSSTSTAKVEDQLRTPIFNSLTVTGATNLNVSPNFTTKVVTSGTTYACTATDYYVLINKTSGSATGVTLPTAPTVGQTLVIKDGKGDAATNNITVTPSSGTIDGASNLVLNNNYASVSVFWSGTNWSIA